MKLIRIVPLAAMVAALMLLIAGPGTRLGLWEFPAGFTLMRWALYIGLAAAALGLVLALIPKTRRGHLVGLLAGATIGLAVAAAPLLLLQQARSVPPIHDISTDTVNPPEFEAIAPLRAEAPNPAEYAGEETAAMQREAYPDIRSRQIAADPATIFEEALASARDMGWKIVDASKPAGRIEATDTTFWFGFKDDVVVRIRPDNRGSIVDVRSKSRVGRSDIGTNAARIRAYLDDLETRLN